MRGNLKKMMDLVRQLLKIITDYYGEDLHACRGFVRRVAHLRSQCVPYVHRGNIVSHLTLYILCIYLVILNFSCPLLGQLAVDVVSVMRELS